MVNQEVQAEVVPDGIVQQQVDQEYLVKEIQEEMEEEGVFLEVEVAVVEQVNLVKTEVNQLEEKVEMEVQVQ
jgi:hypothetical protein